MSNSNIFNSLTQQTAATTINLDQQISREPIATEFGHYQKFRISGIFAGEAYSIQKNLIYGIPAELLEGYFDGSYIVDTRLLPLIDNDCVPIQSWELSLRNSEHKVMKKFTSYMPNSQAELEVWENLTLCKFRENTCFLQLAFSRKFRGRGKVNLKKNGYGEALSLAVFLNDDWGEGTINVVSGKSEPFSEIVSQASKARRTVSSRIKSWFW
ncbi:MAG: hypothetical protein VKL59_16890 [Nostocaceae cyanobacterium]|nr:hypothetical protein [Nostocaceae cyanobacterium]